MTLARGAIPEATAELGPVLDRLDWSQPWYAPWREHGEPVAARVMAGHALSGALNVSAGQQEVPMRFIDHADLPLGQAYERYIFESRQCPTRAGLHDFFNGICWLGLPQSKARLNAVHVAEIGRGGIGARRGPVRDAITVFDENGAILAAPEPLWDALLQRDWRRLFVELRPLWAEARLLIVGHALLEQLAQPRKNLCAHVWAEPAPVAALAAPAEADAWLAARLTPGRLAAKPFTPLPVLGWPGWCPTNGDPAFYDDARVFRPPRAHSQTQHAQSASRP